MQPPLFHSLRERAAGHALPVTVEPGEGQETLAAPVVRDRVIVGGVELDAGRLVILDRQARQARAVTTGLNDAYHTLLAAENDLMRRRQRLVANGYTAAAAAEAERQLAALDAEAATAAARRAALTTELEEAGAVSAAAGATLRAAVSFAREAGLAVPAGVDAGR